MSKLPQPLRWYLLAIVVCALVISTTAIYLSSSLRSEQIPPFFLFLGLICVVHFWPVRYTGRMMLYLSTTLGIAAVWILPPVAVIVIALCDSIIPALGRIKWYRVIFNICQDIISVGGTALLFSLIADSSVPQSWMTLIWIVLIGVFYMGASTGLLGTVITLSNPAEYTWQRWKQNVQSVFTYIDATLFVCGVVLGVLWFVSVPAFALGLALLGTMYWSLRSNAVIHQASTHRSQFQEALTNLLSTTNVGQQLELSLKQLWHLFPIERAAIVLFEADVIEGPVIVASGDAQDLHAICASPEILQALSEPREIRRIEKEAAYVEHCKLPALLVPLHTAESVVGAMVIVLQENRLDVLDPRFITTYAAQATLAVVQARMINHIQTSQEQLVRAERLAAVGTLAAGVAHEFNNVLAIICNTAEAAALQADSAAHRRALNIVSTTAKRGGSITHGLLTFTRQIEPRRELVQIQDAIDPVLAMLESRFKNEQIRLVKDLSPVAPLMGDLGLLSQAVLNLATNALDAMPSGGTLTMRLWQEQQTIHLSVQDTGQGIPDDVRAKLFEPFITTKHPAQQTIGGNGLGLPITYGIVTSHGGAVEVDSCVGQGTTMHISFPASADQPVVVAPPPAPIIEQIDGPLRVMVVDDEPLIGMGLAQILEQDGHQVTWFEDPEQAVAVIERQAPDLLIADIHMPKLDGLTLLRQIRQQYPAMRQILITGQLHAHQRDEVLAIGATIVSKPFSGSDIRALLGQVGPITATAIESSSPRLRARDAEQMLRDDLRHRLMNYVSSLEGMFRLSRRGKTDPVAHELAMRYFAQTIGELSVFVRAEQLLGLLNNHDKTTALHLMPLRLDHLLAEAADWIMAGNAEKEWTPVHVVCPTGLEIVGNSKSLLTAVLAALHNSHASIRRAGMSEHSITLTAAHHGGDLLISVEDTGAGFSPSLLDQINQELQCRAGEDMIGKFQSRHGLSLGIALMARVARLHSGSVEFGNRQDAPGAWVQFRLPAQAARQPINVTGVRTTLDALAA